MKNLFALALTILFFNNWSNAQTYQLQSIDNKTENIKVKTDYVDNIIQITYNDKIFKIANFMDLDGKIEVVSNRFLKIRYLQRVGVGIRMTKTVLFCISEKKLCESLLLLSEYKEEVINTFSGHSDSLSLNHKVENVINFTLDTNNGFSINWKSHKQRTSLSSPKGNYDYNSNGDLKFDERTGVFYSEKKKIKGEFKLIRSNAPSSKKSLNGTFFIISINGGSYIYLEGEWLELGNFDSLISDSVK